MLNLEIFASVYTEEEIFFSRKFTKFQYEQQESQSTWAVTETYPLPWNFLPPAPKQNAMQAPLQGSMVKMMRTHSPVTPNLQLWLLLRRSRLPEFFQSTAHSQLIVVPVLLRSRSMEVCSSTWSHLGVETVPQAWHTYKAGPHSPLPHPAYRVTMLCLERPIKSMSIITPRPPRKQTRSSKGQWHSSCLLEGMGPRNTALHNSSWREWIYLEQNVKKAKSKMLSKTLNICVVSN